MAGQWIAWCKGLSRKPEVLAIGKASRKTRREVAAILMEFWEWADDQTADGFIPGAAPSDLADMISGTDAEFWLAVQQVGWLVFKSTGVEVPRFSRWLGQSAKKRLNKNIRQSVWRAHDKREDELPFSENGPAQNGAGEPVITSTDVDAHVDDLRRPEAPTREEKRTEDKNSAPSERADEPPAAPVRGQSRVWFNDAVAVWQDGWKAKYGERYSFTGRDGKSLKWMLGEIAWDVARWREIVAGYLGDGSAFLAGRRHDFQTLASQFNTFKVSAKAQPPPGRAKGFSGSAFAAKIQQAKAEGRA